MRAFLTLILLTSILMPVVFCGIPGLHSGNYQKSQTEDIDRFLNRFKEPLHINLLQSITWTLTHDYSDFRHMEEVLKTVQLYFQALAEYEKGAPASLNQIGGIKGLKDKLTGWLADDDQAIRAFAAVLLGISGDRLCARQLLSLLKNRKYKKNDLLHYDRGQAAIALGLIGAKEHASNLAPLLGSANEYDRTGAAFGLGLLKEKRYARNVARLLNDANPDVQETARNALEMMGASEMIKGNQTKKRDSK